jgi:hypothetical protein
LDITVFQIPPISCRFPYSSTDTVDAHAALFHNSPAAHGYIRVEVVSQILRPYGFPVVEKTDQIWTAVGTVSGPHAPVVDLDVKTLRIVVRGKNRAHRFTRGIFTMLTHYGDEAGLDIWEFSFPVSFYANP